MDGTPINEVASFEELVSAGGKRRFTTATLPIGRQTIRIRSLFERELSDYQAAIQAATGERERHNRLKAANRQFIAMCLVDSNGNRIVPANEVGRLADLDAADSSHLYDACVEHCGINKQDLDDLVKNSEPTTPSEEPTS